MFLLGLSACGYKKGPYYQETVPTDDANVKFIIKEPSKDANETVK